jgi:hypothetical protein
MRLARVLVLLGLLVAVVGILAFAIPEYLVSDGLASFVGQERAAGESALWQARISCGEPIDLLVIRKLKVVDVVLQGEGCRELDGLAYRAAIRVYTCFGIPLHTISVDCGEVICYP